MIQDYLHIFYLLCTINALGPKRKGSLGTQQFGVLDISVSFRILGQDTCSMHISVYL